MIIQFNVMGMGWDDIIELIEKNIKLKKLILMIMYNLLIVRS